MLRRAVILVLAFMVGFGCPAIVQGLAWATMLADRLPERPLVDAVRSTFDGSEPCQLCCVAQRLAQDELHPSQVPEAPKAPRPAPSSGKHLKQDGIPNETIFVGGGIASSMQLPDPGAPPVALGCNPQPELPPPRV